MRVQTFSRDPFSAVYADLSIRDEQEGQKQFFFLPDKSLFDYFIDGNTGMGLLIMTMH